MIKMRIHLANEKVCKCQFWSRESERGAGLRVLYNDIMVFLCLAGSSYVAFCDAQRALPFTCPVTLYCLQVRSYNPRLGDDPTTPPISAIKTHLKAESIRFASHQRGGGTQRYPSCHAQQICWLHRTVINS